MITAQKGQGHGYQPTYSNACGNGCWWLDCHYNKLAISSGRQQKANQEALLAEYSALRQEISQIAQNQRQFIGAALAVASAFIVYGFQAQNSFAFLAANIILLVAMYMGADSVRQIISTATYLSAIVEPKVEGLQWETMLAERRKKEVGFSLKLSYPLIIYMYAFISIGCIFFAWLLLRDYRILYVLLYCCITLIFTVSFVGVSFYAFRVSSNQYRSDCVSRWKKIEEELYPTVTTIHTNT